MTLSEDDLTRIEDVPALLTAAADLVSKGLPDAARIVVEEALALLPPTPLDTGEWRRQDDEDVQIWQLSRRTTSTYGRVVFIPAEPGLSLPDKTEISVTNPSADDLASAAAIIRNEESKP